MATTTTITMFAAGNGDAFLVEHSATDRITVLIDGGYSSSFRTSILPVLSACHEARSPLDLLVTTHIDADHITGIVTLLRENRNAISPRIVDIDRIWHNSLRSLATIESDSTNIATGDRELLEEIKSRSYADAEQDVDAEISANQGSSLANLLANGGYCWNEGAGSTPIISGTQLDLSTDSRIIVISPNSDRLFSLRDWWISEVRRLGYTGLISANPLMQDAFEFMCSFEFTEQAQSFEEISAQTEHDQDLADIYEPDSSITNGSSIAFVLKCGRRHLLFLGDSWAEDVIAGLKQFSGLQFSFTFDAIKISHHGSYRNTSPELLELIDSPNYLISTNGEKHFHPDVEVLKAIVDRPANFERHLFFNYNTAASNFMKSYKSKGNASFVIHEGNNIQLTMDD